MDEPRTFNYSFTRSLSLTQPVPIDHHQPRIFTIQWLRHTPMITASIPSRALPTSHHRPQDPPEPLWSLVGNNMIRPRPNGIAIKRSHILQNISLKWLQITGTTMSAADWPPPTTSSTTTCCTNQWPLKCVSAERWDLWDGVASPSVHEMFLCNFRVAETWFRD